LYFSTNNFSVIKEYEVGSVSIVYGGDEHSYGHGNELSGSTKGEKFPE
jgi:hypothetical protein